MNGFQYSNIMKKTMTTASTSMSRRVVPKLAAAVLGSFAAGVVFCTVRLSDHGNHTYDDDVLPRPTTPDRLARLRSGGRQRRIPGSWDASDGSIGPLDAVWPKRVAPETEEYEEIIHPANPDESMLVPRFWSDPMDDGDGGSGGLMSRDRAMRIGTCARSDAIGNIVRGEKCPLDDRTIFVSLASYRDYHCRITLESIFARAAHPERIRAAVIDQTKGDDPPCHMPETPCNRDPEQMLCKHRDRIDVYPMAAILAVGPVFARHISNRFYRGEYYAMQVDAQVLFAENWDRDIIRQHDRTGDEMAVISSSLSNAQEGLSTTGMATSRSRPVVCETHYYGTGDFVHLDTGTQPSFEPKESGVPELQPFWSAAFSFARGHFVVNVPYDMYQPMIFSGEEISVAIRAFSKGYDFFSVGSNVCFHVFATGENEAKRKSVPLFWENEAHYEEISKEMSEKSMARLIGIIKMTDLNIHAWNHVGKEKYGIGKARDPSKFFETFGIDIMQKKHEHHLCDIVEKGHMHEMFINHLRADGMGVDYSKIEYKFKDPRPD